MDPHKKKAIAALLIAHANPMGSAGDEGEESDESGAVHEGHIAAAKDILSAVKDNDAEELAHALMAFWQMVDQD